MVRPGRHRRRGRQRPRGRAGRAAPGLLRPCRRRHPVLGGDTGDRQPRRGDGRPSSAAPRPTGTPAVTPACATRSSRACASARSAWRTAWTRRRRRSRRSPGARSSSSAAGRAPPSSSPWPGARHSWPRTWWSPTGSRPASSSGTCRPTPRSSTSPSSRAAAPPSRPRSTASSWSTPWPDAGSCASRAGQLRLRPRLRGGPGLPRGGGPGHGGARHQQPAGRPAVAGSRSPTAASPTT